MKYYAICFTDEKFEKTRQRYAAQLSALNIFEKVIQYSPKDFDDDFVQQHQDFIRNNPKGYGFFIWKPYFVLKALNEMNDGDILVYGDAGNEILGSREECLRIFNTVNQRSNKIPVVAMRVGWNIRWIKSDLYFRMGFKIFYPFKIMVEANRIVIKKTPETMKFVKEWLHYCTVDYRNIDETRSSIPQLPFFVQHRYDQSVFSILFHKYNGREMDFGEAWKASRLRF
jgi:hypothetical protein